MASTGRIFVSVNGYKKVQATFGVALTKTLLLMSLLKDDFLFY